MATLDDIKSVLEGIRSDLGTSAPTASGTLSAADLAAHTEALRENTTATEALGRETERTSTSMRDMEETSTGAAASFTALGKRAAKLQKSLFTLKGSVMMIADGLKMIAEGLLQVGKNTLDATNKLNELTTGMRAQTGASDALVNSIGKVYDRTLMMGVSLEEAASATNTLMHGMSDFTKITEEQQEALVRDSATLQEIGVSFEAFSSIVETGTKLLGMGASESADMVYKLRGASIDMGIPLDTMMQKLPHLTDKLADMGDQTFQTAIDMMKLGKETGVSMDALSQLDDQMYTFEGATKFAAGMNQALGGTFFNPHELMQAYDEGAPAVAKLIASSFDDAGKDIGSMGRRELKFFADRAGIGVADFKKLLGNEMGGLDSEMGKTVTTRAEAEMDAQTRMKSNVELLANQKKMLEEMPVAAVEEKMRGMQNAMAPTARSVAATARDMEIVAAESVAAEGAMAAMAANAVASAKTGATGSMLQGLGTLALGLAAFFPNLIARIPAFIGSIMTTIGGMISTAYTWIGVGLIDFFSMSVAGMAATLAGLAMAAYSIYEAVTAVYDAIFEVLAAGGDWLDQMVAVPIAIGKGFAEAIDFVLSGFGLFEEGLLSKFSRLFNPGGKSFLEAYVEIDWSYLWEGLVESFQGPINDFKEMAAWIIETWDSVMGNSSPSTVFARIGQDMVDGLLSPFDAISALLEPIMEDMLETMPAPVRAIYEGAGKLGELATSAATATSESYDAMIEALTGKDAEQNITVVQELDGREVDKKILKVVGGVVQPLTR